MSKTSLLFLGLGASLLVALGAVLSLQLNSMTPAAASSESTPDSPKAPPETPEILKALYELKYQFKVNEDERTQLRARIAELEGELQKLNTDVAEFKSKKVDPHLKHFATVATRIEADLPTKIAEQDAATKEYVRADYRNLRVDIKEVYNDLFARIKKYHPETKPLFKPRDE